MASARKVCVTGGAGFVGSHLARTLLNAGNEVRVLDNSQTLPSILQEVREHPALRLMQGSVLNPADVNEAVAGSSIVYHLASIVGVRRTMEHALDMITLNLAGTKRVLDAAVHHGARVVFTSSADVYGLLNKVPLHEDDYNLYAAPTVRRWVYARVKSVEEELCLEYMHRFGIPTVVLRYFNSYGPDMDIDEPRRVMPLFIDALLNRRNLRVVGTGHQTRCFCYISDMVTGTMLAGEVEAAAGKVLNIGARHEITIAGLARLVLEVARELGLADGLTWDLTSSREFYGEDFEDIGRRVPDLTRAATVLGYRPVVDLRAGVRRTLEHYQRRAARVEMVS